jgi:hypothetical protein
MALIGFLSMAIFSPQILIASKMLPTPVFEHILNIIIVLDVLKVPLWPASNRCSNECVARLCKPFLILPLIESNDRDYPHLKSFKSEVRVMRRIEIVSREL